MPENELSAEKKAYQDASRGFDLLVSCLAAALLITTLALDSEADYPSPTGILEVVAILLFSLALIANLRKVEQTLMVLGTSYTILETEKEARVRGGEPAAGVVRELSQAVQIVSLRAARAHRLRSWLLIVGILTFAAARLMAAISESGIA